MPVAPRVSIAIPYWNRRAALELMLDDLEAKYPDLGVEVSICDDGSDRSGEAAFQVRGLGHWPHLSIRLSTLPVHATPRCPAIAILAAVESATSDRIILTNPETTHRDARVLPEILAELDRDANAYVIASCWEADLQRWYEHPVHRPAGLHWCVGFRKSLWHRSGGVDPGLMAGQAYDDNDIRNRMHKAGARFVRREDLIVDHHRSLQRKVLSPDGGDRDYCDPKLVAVNRQRYADQWGRYWPDHGGKFE
jgi:hypothetical protein